MCFVIAIVALVLSYNFFIADNFLAAISSVAVSIFFIYLMIKNILFVKNLKNKKREKLDN
jgi:amino acid permease